MPDSAIAPSRWLVIASFAIVYLVWGSTYLAIRLAIETIPPLLMAGVRFTVAGLALYLIMQLIRYERTRWRQWINAGWIGAFLFAGGNGLVCLAEQSVASGPASLIIATTPLWMVVIECIFVRAAFPPLRVIAGLVIGSAGTAILITSMGGATGEVNLWGGLMLLTACLSWAIGSLRSQHVALPRSAFTTAAMQMIGGGVVLIAIGTSAGEWADLDWQAVTFKSVLSVGYLILFGSMLALSAYTYLLRTCRASSVSTYAYVNPVVALALGVWLGNETFNMASLAAAILIIAAVVLIMTQRTSKAEPRATRAEESSQSAVASQPSAGQHCMRPEA
jgi:drug/metabolite transporter (DMT)-like permease